jgi:hypothetical protein
MSEDSHPYFMSLSLNVLNHLGLNLYSNIPAVLSETVANSWDADAENVSVNIDPVKKRIVIKDDGDGMDLNDINAKYLTVGYRKEDDVGRITKKGRRAMGRKGIGKLSLFSIANQIEIRTLKAGQKHAFRMDVAAIKQAILNKEQEQRVYYPEPLDPSSIEFSVGTEIILTDLKKQIHSNPDALKKRLARRFGIIDAEFAFSVSVNGNPITAADRDYFHKLQYIWYFGERSEKFKDRADKSQYQEERSGKIAGTTYEVSGWLGTVEEAGALKIGDENLNKILLLIRGKLGPEDILSEFNEGGVYSKYVIGEIYADFLDLDDKEDIATSNRQHIDEDDPRYLALKQFIGAELKHIKAKWTDLRNQEGTEKALEIPAIKEWHKSLDRDARKKASILFGKINQLTIDSPGEKRELFKYSILAFENLRYRGNLEALNAIESGDIETLGLILHDLTDIDAALYYQIVSERLGIVKKLHENVDSNVLERIIQEHIYKNLWLIDPAWERASESAYLEERVTTAFAKVTASLTPEEAAGRFDIRYATTWGKHVIIELKRASVPTDAFKLSGQVEKYKKALRKLLNEVGSIEPIEVICLVGKPLTNWATPDDRLVSQNSMAQLGIRVVLYQELINNAYRAYSKYLERSAEASGKLSALIQSLDSYGIDSAEADAKAL